MADIATISAILSSIKTATEIAKAIKDSDTSIEKAELKLKIADLISVLADLKMEMVELNSLIDSKNQEIEALGKAFDSKDKVVRYRDAYYMEVDGLPNGLPYCLRCWDVDHKLRQLARSGNSLERAKLCVDCGHKYSDLNTVDNPKILKDDL